jgi:hypothetical protein
LVLLKREFTYLNVVGKILPGLVIASAPFNLRVAFLLAQQADVDTVSSSTRRTLVGEELGWDRNTIRAILRRI